MNKGPVQLNHALVVPKILMPHYLIYLFIDVYILRSVGHKKLLGDRIFWIWKDSRSQWLVQIFANTSFEQLYPTFHPFLKLYLSINISIPRLIVKICFSQTIEYFKNWREKLIVHVKHFKNAPPIRWVNLQYLVFEPINGNRLLKLLVVNNQVKVLKPLNALFSKIQSVANFFAEITQIFFVCTFDSLYRKNFILIIGPSHQLNISIAFNKVYNHKKVASMFTLKLVIICKIIIL